MAGDLVVLERGLPGVSGCGEAVAALVLARDLDAGVDAPLSARVAAVRELREGLAALRVRVPEAPAVDRLDELASRRAGRVAG